MFLFSPATRQRRSGCSASPGFSTSCHGGQGLLRVFCHCKLSRIITNLSNLSLQCQLKKCPVDRRNPNAHLGCIPKPCKWWNFQLPTSTQCRCRISQPKKTHLLEPRKIPPTPSTTPSLVHHDEWLLPPRNFKVPFNLARTSFCLTKGSWLWKMKSEILLWLLTY